MQFSAEQITQIAGDDIQETNIEGNPKYDWVDIVNVEGRPEKSELVLYLSTHSTGEEGWDEGFDRRNRTTSVVRDRGWHLAVESGTETGGGEYMMVRNLDIFAEKLYEAARSKTNPYIVGVTGSVGKTTSVAFLEHLIKTSGSEVTRFYSKRLTPLSVMCHYINKVDENTPFVVMEYSTYMKDHVEKLSNLLPPNISFLTNIYETHINPGMFENKKQIYESKIKIKPSRSPGFINNRVLDELDLPIPSGWEGFEVKNPEGLKNDILPPTLRTAELYTLGTILAENINIKPEIVRRAFETFRPVENRIIKCNYRDKDVYYHGETSGGSRLNSWFETLDGTVPWLMVESVNFADEDPHGFKNLLENIFASEKTFILDTRDNRNLLPVQANFVNPERFMDIMRNKMEGYAVFHKGLSVRTDGFNPEEYLNKTW